MKTWFHLVTFLRWVWCTRLSLLMCPINVAVVVNIRNRSRSSQEWKNVHFKMENAVQNISSLQKSKLLGFSLLRMDPWKMTVLRNKHDSSAHIQEQLIKMRWKIYHKRDSFSAGETANSCVYSSAVLFHEKYSLHFWYIMIFSSFLEQLILNIRGHLKLRIFRKSSIFFIHSFSAALCR